MSPHDMNLTKLKRHMEYAWKIGITSYMESWHSMIDKCHLPLRRCWLIAWKDGIDGEYMANYMEVYIAWLTHGNLLLMHIFLFHATYFSNKIMLSCN